MKLYKSKIKLFDRFTIFDRKGNNSPYLTRYRIIDTPWFGVFVHQMHRPDASPILHDHPWAFVSFVLRGGYIERYKDMSDLTDAQVHVRRINHFNLKRLRDAHYISMLDRTPTWTLVFVGATERVWGYWERGTNEGWYRTIWHEHINHAPGLDYESEIRSAGA